MISKESIERKRAQFKPRTLRKGNGMFATKVDLTHTQCDDLFVIGRTLNDTRQGREWLAVCTKMVDGQICGNLRTLTTYYLMQPDKRLTCVSCISFRPYQPKTVTENSPQAIPGACKGLCRRDGKYVWAQPDCPAHGVFERYDPLFARKPQSFTAVESEAA